MVSNLFTAFALIATGRVEVPPAPSQPIPVPEIRGFVRDADAEDGEADKGLRRR
jgi:hypothetical protein